MTQAQKTDDTVDADKRRHPRFPLRAYADLKYSSKEWEAHVLDLSESGARLAILSEHLLQKGDALRLRIQVDKLNLLTSSKKTLDLHGQLIHVREHLLGFEFQPDTPVDKTLLYELLSYIENSH